MIITTKFNIGDIVWYKYNGFVLKGRVHSITIKQIGSIKIIYEVVCDYAPKQYIPENELHLSLDKL